MARVMDEALRQEWRKARLERYSRVGVPLFAPDFTLDVGSDITPPVDLAQSKLNVTLMAAFRHEQSDEAEPPEGLIFNLGVGDNGALLEFDGYGLLLTFYVAGTPELEATGEIPKHHAGRHVYVVAFDPDPAENVIARVWQDGRIIIAAEVPNSFDAAWADVANNWVYGSMSNVSAVEPLKGRLNYLPGVF